MGDPTFQRSHLYFLDEVGQTVTDVVPLNRPEVITQPAKSNHRRWVSSLAAMAACLVLIVTSAFFVGQMPYASVYMTINPEVRIDVNRRDVVVGVEGINSDGANLLEDYDHRKKDLDTLMDELVDLAIGMGYLHEGGKITLSLDAEEEWVISHSNHLNQHLSEHLTDKITVTIDIEQKQSTQETTTVPTIPTGTIVIPAGPDNYGESDYGQDATDGDGDSGYASPDGGDSAYDNLDDGQTDYDDSLAIINSCTGLIGQPTRNVVTNLVTAIGEAGYFVDASGIWLPDLGEIADLKDGYH